MSDGRASGGRAAGVVVRAPNHLGDVVMALPALRAAGEADVVVVRWLAPLVEMAALPGRVLPLDRGFAGFRAAAAALRRARYARGVLLPPSLSSALLFAAGGVRHRRGTDTDGRGLLLHEREPRLLPGEHRRAAYWRLVTGERTAEPPAPSLAVPDEARDRWAALAGRGDRPLVGLVPGSHASSRRWDADRFAALARRLTRDGARVVVFGGPAERALTAAVAGEVGLDAGGRTDLPLLAAGLAACALVVANDSGPLHLAAAVGAPTVSFWGAGDPVVTGPAGPRHELLRHPELPCVPCVRNTCPRQGRGYVLPDATRECLRLISTDDAVAAVRGHGSFLPTRS